MQIQCRTWIDNHVEDDAWVSSDDLWDGEKTWTSIKPDDWYTDNASVDCYITLKRFYSTTQIRDGDRLYLGITPIIEMELWQSNLKLGLGY